jgi:hypothetical protein
LQNGQKHPDAAIRAAAGAAVTNRPNAVDTHASIVRFTMVLLSAVVHPSATALSMLQPA